MVFTLEPYDRGTSFTDCFTRLKYFFSMNKVKVEDKLTYFIPTTEDFVLNLKFQAKFCGFGKFKEIAILDRFIAGLRKNKLKQRLLSKDKPILANAVRLITTWEVACTKANAAEQPSKENPNMVAAIEIEATSYFGIAVVDLCMLYDLAKRYEQHDCNYGASTSRNSFGFKMFDRLQQMNRGGRMIYRPRFRNFQQRASSERANRHKKWQRPEYCQMLCYFYGVKSHIKTQCLKLKNIHRDAMNLFDSYHPRPSEDRQIPGMLERMRNHDSDDDESETCNLQHMKVSSMNTISNPCLMQFNIEDKHLKMEVDCGSSVTIISKMRYLSKYNSQLIVVNGAKLKIEREATVLVKFNEKEKFMHMLVVDCDNDFYPFLDRTWLDVFFPNWRKLFTNYLNSNNLIHECSKIAVDEIKSFNGFNAEGTKEDDFLQQYVMQNGCPERVVKPFMEVFQDYLDLKLVDDCFSYKQRVVRSKLFHKHILNLFNGDASNSMASSHNPKSLHNFAPIVVSCSKWIEVEWVKQDTNRYKVLKSLIVDLDNGPPFNSHCVKHFLESEGIRVMKILPYNHSGNGKERLVRTNKRVLKRFIIIQNIVELDLEGQINVFLFNFNKSNITKDGDFPTGRIYRYTPKIIIDSVNPKKHHTKLFYVPHPDDEIHVMLQSGNIPKKSNDAFENELWYKHHNLQYHARWIKTTYIKKHSRNIFQIRIRSVSAIVYWTQTKIYKEGVQGQRPNDSIARQEKMLSGKRMIPDDERAAGDVELEVTLKGGKKVKRQISNNHVELRKAERSRESIWSEVICNDYVPKVFGLALYGFQLEIDKNLKQLLFLRGLN